MIYRGGIRVTYLFYFSYVALLLCMLGTVVSVIWPFIGVFLLWQFFGTVATLSLAWKVICLISALISVGTQIISANWVGIARLVFVIPYRYDPRLADQSDRVLASLYSEKAIAIRSGLDGKFSPVTFEGHVYTFESVHELSKTDKPLAWALLTYFLYCPSQVTYTTNTILTIVLLVFAVYRRIYSAFVRWLKFNLFIFKVAFTYVWMGLVLSPSTLVWQMDVLTTVLGWIFYPFYLLFRHGEYKLARAYIRLVFVVITLRLLSLAIHVRLISSRYRSSAKGFSPRVESFRAFWNNVILDLGRVVDNVALPHFVRKMPDLVDIESINQTNAILEELGWPAAPKVTAEPNTAPANFEKYRPFFIGGTVIRQGIRQLRLQVSSELENLKGLAPEYKRSEQYQTIENELESVSRYFVAAEVDLPDVGVDEVWVLIGDIFKNSVLTPFSYIAKKWEKKYGLGPFWGSVTGSHWRKLSRRKFITAIGGMGNLVKLWAKTFEVSPGLIPVAPVSVKGEALPPKKWMNDVVRTVVGAPLTHYITSTIWNYQPNHNFKFWSTNIKVGMPLNGAFLSRLWAEHDAFTIHFAGDFTAFDSTVTGKVVELIKKVRKKGFERHRDYAKICFLIDQTYESLKTMPLMTTSTGNIFQKSTGLSTGHSSTSADNSLAVTIYYLAVWKELTGLSAHEFRYYCKLSNYGDDHLLSWLSSAPSVWTKENIMAKMNSFGVTLRDEEPSGNLFKMSFLSKFARRPTFADVKIFDKMGISVPKVVIFHDPVKLVGKAYAPSKDVQMDRSYRAKRLISYLSLTAHHPDLYDKIRHDIDLVLVSKKGNKLPYPVAVPSYEQVVRDWYNPKKHIVEEDSDVDPNTEIYDYSAQGYLEHFVNALSVLPDLINPAVYNMGYTSYFMSLCGPRLHWPIELLRRSNEVLTDSHLVSVLRKTPYDFLSSSPSITTARTDHSSGGLLLKHWLFLMLKGPTLRSKVSDQVAFIDKKLADLNFILNGYVQPTVRRLDLPIIEILLISALDFIPDLPVLEGAMLIRAPSFSSIVENLYGTVVNIFWSRIPANMKQVANSVNSLSDEDPSLLVEAGTGTGKSTTLVSFVYKYYGHKYDRLIVVEPRAILPETLVPYLRSAFGVPAHQVGEGKPFDAAMRLIVCTPQEVILHPDWFVENNLFFIDECHTHESAMNAVVKVVKRLNKQMIMASATPSAANIADCKYRIKLQIANVWQVVEVSGQKYPLIDGTSFRDYWHHYKLKVVDCVRSEPLMQFLIFVVDIGQAEELADSLPGRSCILSSRNKTIDPRAKFYIATAVADVGLTIPAVDWVITSNIIRLSKTVKGVTRTHLSVLDSATLRQRRGRVGRTHNGFYTLIQYTGHADWLEEPQRLSDLRDAMALLANGTPASFIGKWYPELISHFFGKDGYDRSHDEVIDKWVSAMSLMEDVLNKPVQRTFKASLDGGGDVDLYTVKGNTLPTNLHDGSYVPRPLTSEQALKICANMAVWVAENDVPDFTIGNITRFFRMNFVNLNAFKMMFESQRYLTIPDEYIEGLGDETGRFGKRTNVPRGLALQESSDLWESGTIDWDI